MEQMRYVFKGPFRFVEPYKHTYKTFVKNRWIGMKLLDVMLHEFRSNTKEYYQEIIKSGLLVVNGKTVYEDY